MFFCLHPAYVACSQEGRLLSRLLARRGAGGVSLREYGRRGWQFHAKGLWLSPPSDDDADGADSDPVATLVGSSNYGVRSARRDIEAQLAVVTRHAGLRDSLRREWDALTAHAPLITLPQLAARRHGVGARIGAYAARRFM